ncbi:PH domain-containing protein [Brevundimonas sp. FT23028]|uniref:PH domain-containing protein n=1 Tax=Brevundimonas sp. FT23028 TaxID=3393748 RepID=UPI003B586DC4
MVQMDMEFRPAPPTRKELFPLCAFGLVLVLIAVRAATHPDGVSPFLVGAASIFAAAGFGLTFRLRFPGSPTLRVTREALTYSRGGHSRTLRWADVAEVQLDHRSKELRVIPTDGGRPLVMHSAMTSADGRRFDGVIEHWWKPGAA